VPARLKLVAVLLVCASPFVLAWAAIARLVRRTLDADGGDLGAVTMTLVFAASPGVVFLAHEIEGVSFAAMSAQWHVPLNTLLARKRYAVLALRSQLRAEYGDLIV